MFAACKANLKKGNEKYESSWNRCRKEKMCRAALKDDKGKILDEFFFCNERNGIHNLLSRIQSHGKCVAVLESTGNMWMRIHDMLEDIGIDTKLANPYKTKIIAEAKIKSDKLDAIEYYLIYFSEQI